MYEFQCTFKLMSQNNIYYKKIPDNQRSLKFKKKHAKFYKKFLRNIHSINLIKYVKINHQTHKFYDQTFQKISKTLTSFQNS